MIMIDDEVRQHAKEYVDSWNAGETPEPAKEASVVEDIAPEVTESPELTSAKQVAEAARDKDAQEFSDAYHADEPKPVEAPKVTSFKQAFAQARQDGLKAFDWNGKKFTTELKSTAPAAKPAAGPSAALAAADAAKHKPAKPAVRPSVYADNFIADAVSSVKAKLNDNSQVGKAKFHANGKPNLTAR